VIRDLAGHYWFQLGDMEHGVNGPQVFGQIDQIGVRSRFACDFEWAQVFLR